MFLRLLNIERRRIMDKNASLSKRLLQSLTLQIGDKAMDLIIVSNLHQTRTLQIKFISLFIIY